MNRDVLRTVVAPMLAKMGNLDACFKELGHYTVAFLQEAGLSVDEIAAHLGKSRSWVYETLKERPEPRESTDLRWQVLVKLVAQHPEALSIRELSEEISGDESRILSTAQALVKVGQVEFEDGKYRAKAKEIISQGVSEKSSRVAHSAGLTYRLGMNYLDAGDVLFVRLQHVLAPGAWKRAKAKLSELLIATMHEAVKASYEELPDGIGPSVEIHGVMAVGHINKENNHG